MADADSRIETVEDEIKVLKGEVRRTLVDLRALLMREDSPMNESGGGRRAALADREPEDEVPVARSEVNKTVIQEASAAEAPPPTQPPPVETLPTPVPPPAAGGPGQAAAGFEPAPGLQSGATPVPIPPAPSNPGNGDQDRALVDQQRRFEEQEQRMAEQNKQMADLSRMVQNAAGSTEDNSGPDPEQQRRLDDQEKRIADQSRQMAEMNLRMAAETRSTENASDSEREQAQKIGDQERRLEEQRKQMAELGRMVEAQVRSGENALEQDSGHDDETQGGPSHQEDRIADQRRRVWEDVRPAKNDIAETGKTGPQESPPDREYTAPSSDWEEENEEGDWDEDRAFTPDSGLLGTRENEDALRVDLHDATPRSKARQKPLRARQASGRDSSEAGSKPADGPRTRPFNPGRRSIPSSVGSNGPVQHRRGDFERLEQDEPLRENRGSRVYDEYLDLFRETEEMVPQDNHSETLAPLDVNFLGSLVRWTALAKSRVGEQELKGILDLYLGSGHSSPQLRELLTNVSKMVVSPQPDGIQAAQECIDLLSQLHGIFTGGLQIVQIPQDRMPE